MFTDVGYSFRVLYDAFGVYQQLHSIDLAIPHVSRPSGYCLREPPLPADAPALPRIPFTLLVSFLPNF